MFESRKKLQKELISIQVLIITQTIQIKVTLMSMSNNKQGTSEREFFGV